MSKAATPARSSWRDLVKVHPAADLFPMMTAAALVELGKDIIANGLRNPIVFWTQESADEVKRRRRGDRYPKEIMLLDGRNRLAAMEAVGIDLCDESGQLAPKVHGAERPRIFYGGDRCHPDDNSNDPYAYVLSANVQRRHLTSANKHDVVAALLKARPDRSDRATAKIATVSDKTVGAIRRDLEGTAEIPQLEKTIGADGKARSKPRQPASATAPVVEAAPVEAAPVEAAPVEAAPVEAAPVEAAPVEAAPVEAAPVEAAPVEAAPVEAAPVEAAPVEAAPVEAAPVEAAPVEAAPVEAAPVEAAPVEAAPLTAKPRGKRIAARRSGPSPSLVRDKAIMAFASVLHTRPSWDTLDDLARLVSQESARIARIVDTVSLQKRVAHIRVYMQAYGVALDNLRAIE